jgi:crossover junction endodeoxyribonuclease RuvC
VIVAQSPTGRSEGSSSHNRNFLSCFGQSCGTIIGVIGALAIPVRHVTPAKWKKALGLTSDAGRSRAAAIERWPGQADLFARKRDHNRAEAALLGLSA